MASEAFVWVQTEPHTLLQAEEKVMPPEASQGMRKITARARTLHQKQLIRRDDCLGSALRKGWSTVFVCLRCDKNVFKGENWGLKFWLFFLRI